MNDGVSVLDEVRTACREVAARAGSVRIDEERLAEYAATLPLDPAAPVLDPRYHYLGEAETTLAFVLTLDAINFGSGYFPHLRKRPGLSGYFTVAAALTERFAAAGPFDAAALRRLTAADCAQLFDQEPTNAPAMELMTLFGRALNDLGAFIERRFGGRFAGPIAEAAESAERLVMILAEMPFFRDVASYHGRPIPFYKRAQLTAADLALAFGGDGTGRFADLDQLTIFADNLVPHVLRVDGVLHYGPALAARIDAGELIAAGSPEETEIRACGLHAVELIATACRAAGRPTTPMRLDYLLWNRGQGASYKARPRHRARSVYY